LRNSVSGRRSSLAGLYYHISALKEAEIVELAGYREEKSRSSGEGLEAEDPEESLSIYWK